MRVELDKLTTGAGMRLVSTVALAMADGRISLADIAAIEAACEDVIAGLRRHRGALRVPVAEDAP